MGSLPVSAEISIAQMHYATNAMRSSRASGSGRKGLCKKTAKEKKQEQKVRRTEVRRRHSSSPSRDPS
ncbi:hypothetical protein MRB53_032631 [Persea americana]|uniref:Uncharacterized protein n=1 Tax=Persea americana TaxID=3435 RepID=A0ACC2KSA3_PERAE|nr:hypothetical protein MRB53_032631 [Persea americana]